MYKREWERSSSDKILYSSIMKATVFVVLTLLSAVCHALPAGIKRGGNTSTSGYNINIESDAAFCSFLPPKAGDDVGATENDGIPFCTNSTLGGEVFPAGFIKTAHFVQTSGYAQITGSIDRDAYSLSASDGGGQYDNKDINGVTCNGYKYFVNLIEPSSNTFCIRCCQEQSDCNLGMSTKGCSKIVPGDYN